MSSRFTFAPALIAFCLTSVVACGDDNQAENPFGGPAPPAAVAAARPEDNVQQTGRRLSELRIQSALNDEKTTLEFVEIPLNDAIEYIKDKHRIEILFDVPALKDAALDPTALPVSINVHDITLRSALRLILTQFQLTYIIEDEVLQITTKDKANSTLTARIYNVHDLVPASDKAEESSAALAQLADIITSLPSWQTAEGKVKPFNQVGVSALVVTHNAEAHEEIDRTLTKLRKLKPQK